MGLAGYRRSRVTAAALRTPCTGEQKQEYFLRHYHDKCAKTGTAEYTN